MSKVASGKTESIGQVFKRLRKARKLPLRKVSARLDIDQAILSKIERGKRSTTKDQVKKFAKMFNINAEELLVTFYSDQFVYEIAGESCAIEALKLAQKKVKYLVRGDRHK